MALTKVTGPGIVTTTNLRVGILTADNITIGGTITYENVTEIDSVGVVTARGGLHVGAGGTILHILSKDNGKVGIGSTVPTGSLDIYGGDDNPGLTLKRNTGGGDVASIAWHALNASPTTVAKINYRGGAAPGGMQFYTGGGTSSELRMVINPAGLIGIGSDGPGKTLDIKATNPTINVKASGGNDASLELIETSGAQNFSAAGAAGFRVRYDGGDNRLYIDSGNDTTVKNRFTINRDDGKIGINTNNPYAPLSLKTAAASEVASNLADKGILLHAPGATDEQIIPISASFVTNAHLPRCGIGFISHPTADPIQGYAGEIGFYTHDAADGTAINPTHERMRITRSGSIGIGITNPGEKLTVNGKIEARGGNWFIARSGNNSNYAYMRNPEVSDSALSFNTSGERMRIESGGNIGIGTTNPATKVHIHGGDETLFITGDTAVGSAANTGGIIALGGVYHTDGSITGWSQIKGFKDNNNSNNYAGYLSFTTRNQTDGYVERLRIDSDGRVMIGNDDGASMFTVADNLVVGSGNGSEGMTIYSDSTNDGYICFADGTSDPAYRIGQIIYGHQADKLQFRTGGNTERFAITSGGTTAAGISTATNFDLSAISATAYNSSNVVDVFVYDTSQDTDGGEWRKRCGGTSWYHETFSATRGSKKEFPAVAVIVLVGGTVSSYGSDNNTQKILIYDGDDPTLPLWMAFYGHTDSDAFIRGAGNYPQTSVDMFNGQMLIGRNGGYGIATINFIQDRLISYWDGTNIGYYDGNIDRRNIGAGVLNSSGFGIGNVTIYDVAITALKDSPIDISTGLPFPTMALATADGITMIRASQGADKEKYEIYTSKATHASYNEVRKVAMNRYTNKLYSISEGGSIGLLYEYDLPWGKNFTSTTMTGYTGVAWLHYTPHGIQGTSGVASNYHPKYTNTNMALRKNGEIWTVSGDGVSVIKPDFDSDYTMDNTCFVAGIGTDHNSGWMYGRGANGCKIGSLCETTAGILGDKGANLVTNGDFTSNITGWDDQNAAITNPSHVSGKLQMAASGGTGRMQQNVTIENGKTYTFEYQCVSNGGGTNFVHLSTGSWAGSGILATNIGISNTGWHQHTFTSSGTNVYIQLGATNGSTVQFDNIRLYETSEVVINGYMDTGVPNGVFGYDNGDGTVDGVTTVGSATISMDGYALKIEQDSDGSWGGGGAQIPLGSAFVPGVQYRISYRVKTGGATGNFTQGFGCRIQKDNGGHSNNTLVTPINDTTNPSGGNWVNKVGYFTAERANYGLHFFQYYGDDGFIWWIDNLSIKPVANSYAITSNINGRPRGFESRGRITKEAVATGADLCCYKDFDEYNALVQRYDTELDYGTGDFYYMVWVNCSMNGSGSVEGLISRQANEQESGNRIQIQADNNRNVFLYCGGFNDDTTANLSKSGWTHIAFIRRNEMGYFYEDGRLRKYFSDTTNYTNSGANLRIGGLSLGSSIEVNSYPADQTKFALFKTGGIAPSELELRQIVMEERKYFGQNIKCALYGTSNYEIPAVACDTATDTIHIGTGSGRSEFDGLLRINNTTDAITVAVSASNGLVAEE